MANLTLELLNYLNSDNTVKQVVIKVKARFKPRPANSRREELLAAYNEAAEKNCAQITRFLLKESTQDQRVSYSSLGPVNKLIVVAPTAVILRLANHLDVEEVLPNKEFE